jgi:hypothetical protein
MTQPMQFPDPADGNWPGDSLAPDAPLPGRDLLPGPAGAAGEWRGAFFTSLAVLVGTALLGVAGGFLWAAIAPRAALVIVGHGLANVVNSETNAFIAADGWYCVTCLVGGVISGLLGYVFAVRRHGPVAMAAVLIGALAAGLITLWIGQQSGLSTYHHLLATLPAGAYFHDQLVLGSRGAIAFWPLAAGLMAGGVELAALRRDRRQPAAASALPAGHGYPGAVPRYPGGSSGQY